MLTTKEQEKYSRQTLLIGLEGQEKLKHSMVVIVGMGALGTNTVEMLVRSGVGNITIIDDDNIEESNLQRQTLFDEYDVGKSKVKVAKEKLNKINSLVKINPIETVLNEENISLIKQVDLVLDCTDNMETRFLINDFCKKNNLPWIYASCVKKSGYVMPIFPKGPCLRCFLENKEGGLICGEGVLNHVVNLISSLQVNLSMKILLGNKINVQLIYFSSNMQFKKIYVKKKCELCS